MESTRSQRFFACHRPISVFLFGGAFVGMVVWTVIYSPYFTLGFGNIARFAICLAPAGMIGWIGGGLLGFFLLLPWARAQARANGAPFQVGDRVRILSGEHRDRIATVYEVWEERGSVRLDLGEIEREKVTDVFGALEVCRV